MTSLGLTVVLKKKAIHGNGPAQQQKQMELGIQELVLQAEVPVEQYMLLTIFIDILSVL